MFNTLILLAFLGREQPPSGGCVLKQTERPLPINSGWQPPSGGCVLKLAVIGIMYTNFGQPPPCGCVLKHNLDRFINAGYVCSRLRVAEC